MNSVGTEGVNSKAKRGVNIFLLMLRLVFDARHEKTDLKIFVVVISKEGWARMA